jgi:ElaB/YqjD/DUF883 family membrane-anchored ribosome-binding protein
MAYSANANTSNESAARTIADNMSDAATEIAGKAGRQLDKAIGSAEQTVRSMAEQGKEAGERVQEVAGNLKGAVEKSVVDQPMATLAVAAALGFVIGALWKS